MAYGDKCSILKMLKRFDSQIKCGKLEKYCKVVFGQGET